ncbi:MAG: lysylphosphatidylglycerol synthase domain-containing protein [Patescibacteria group bacterium]
MDKSGAKKRSWLRIALQWALALLVLWFVFRRLGGDWPTIRPKLHQIGWGWLLVSILPGLAYFFLRAEAWRRILAGWQLHPPFLRTFSVWAKAEALRFVPGTVWAVVGRITQAQQLGTTKTICTASIVVEAVLMVCSAGLLATGLALGVLQQVIIPSWLVIVIFCSAVLLSLGTFFQKPLAGIVRLFHRLLRREGESAGYALKGAVSYGILLLAWISFAAFQVLVARAFGFANTGSSVAIFSVAFLASWLLGYVTVFAPSGLGVREAVVAALLSPVVGAPSALFLAAVTRVALIVIELIALCVAIGVRPVPLTPPSSTASTHA